MVDGVGLTSIWNVLPPCLGSRWLEKWPTCQRTHKSNLAQLCNQPDGLPCMYILKYHTAIFNCYYTKLDLVQQQHGEGERAKVVGGHDHLVAVHRVQPLAALVHEYAGIVDKEVDLLKLGVDLLGEAFDVVLR